MYLLYSMFFFVLYFLFIFFFFCFFYFFFFCLFAFLFFFFFFQAEDGIRDGTVTGVQTCALPICLLQYHRSCSSVDRSLFPANKKFHRELRIPSVFPNQTHRQPQRPCGPVWT